MDKPYFKIKRITELKEGIETIPESDLTFLDNGKVFQFEYIDGEDSGSIDVEAGIWNIAVKNQTIVLESHSFLEDKFLSSAVKAKEIENCIDCFFNKISVYKELGFEVAKRAALLYGPPGSGKSSTIAFTANKYARRGDTAVITWHTDKFEAYEIKRLFKRLRYNVKNLILVAEDVEGVETNRDMDSVSSLLSLLDNTEKTFTIPTFIIATTNHPEAFMENLMNRPNRFDDKIEVGFPDEDQRQMLLEFFVKTSLSPEEAKLIRSKSCTGFTPAHLREVVIRSKLYDKTITESIESIKKDIDLFKKNFKKQEKFGFNHE